MPMFWLQDVLQHGGNADILNFSPKLAPFRMASITNGFHRSGMSKVNPDIEPGGWRPVDHQRSPFNLTGSYVYWFNAGEPKYVSLHSS